MKILLTGATGYVGGRLLKALEQQRYSVRCLARRPDYLEARVETTTQVVQGDLLERATLSSALEGMDIGYYLVHSMGSSRDFLEQDRRAAEYFAGAARQSGLKRIIYLGGLGPETALSPHLASRHEVGRILRESGVPTIEFRASIIIGSGSLSFELIRALVDRLPVMITPKWARSQAQPIGIEDVIAYLIAGLDLETVESRVFEIGGPDRQSYYDLMKTYAELRGLRRLIIPVPVLTLRLSSLWLGLVTPVYARVGKKLIDSVKNESIVTDDAALTSFPLRPLGVREAMARALVCEDWEFAQTRWSDALSSRGATPTRVGVKIGSRFVDSRKVTVSCSPEVAFRPVRRIGGATGWYYGNWLWVIRGVLDLVVGGAGLRRGRRDPEFLEAGDTVDFWRVEAIQANRLLLLSAEMKLPGRAWLQFEIEGAGKVSTITQTALFDPAGILGLAYWYLIYPLHNLVFAGMLRNIALAAQSGKTE